MPTRSDTRRIAVATFGRSDFSILRPLCRLLDADPGADLGLLVAGAHFEQLSGHTVAEVEASGLPIWARIDGGDYTRSPLGTAEMMATQMAGFAKAVTECAPDLVLILGDRFEAIAAGLALVPLGVPVGHISGGSVTEGAIDDVFRHCLTKVAALHFCDLPRFAQRIHYMGEPTDRITTTGALGLDAFADSKPADLETFATQFGLDGLRPGFVLATIHPESANPEVTEQMVDAAIAALGEAGRQVVYTYPNADPGSSIIVEKLEAAALSPGAYCVRGFGADWYPTAMAHAGMMFGNSSGGIIEAASFGLGVVDIGDRQKGREHGANVLHCGRDRSAILSAVETVMGPAFAAQTAPANVYGDGRGAQRVMATLASLDWDALKRPKQFAEPESDFAGALLELP